MNFQRACKLGVVGLVLAFGFVFTSAADSLISRRIEDVKDVEFTFGESRIVFLPDRSMTGLRYDQLMQVFLSGKLQIQLRGIWPFKIVASPDNDLFVGVSNTGYLTPAAIVFNSRGELLLFARHETAEFRYCSKSVTLIREWLQRDDPEVKFERLASGGFSIRVRTCKGDEVDLFEEVGMALARANGRGNR